MKKIEEPDKRDGWYEIDVESATALLTNRPKNRPLKRGLVAKYTGLIESGLWEENGEPVILGPKGELRDGQNRLRAVQVAGKPIRTYVVHTKISGTKAFDTMNQGGIRSVADRLAIQGVEHYTTVAALTRKVLDYERGFTRTYVAHTPQECRVRYLRERALFEEACSLAHKYAKEIRGIMAVSLLAFIALMTIKEDREAGLKFSTSLASGENLSASNPAMLLRKRLIEDALSKARLSYKERLALCIKAWIAFRGQKAVKILRWRQDKEPYPRFEDT